MPEYAAGVRGDLVAAGTELIGDVIWAAEAFDDPAYDGFGWFFFRAPDGNVYVLQQDGLPRQSSTMSTADALPPARQG